MKNFRELANELKNTNVELTKENRCEYAKAIKKLVPTVNGNAELANIAKSFIYTVARVIGTDSNEIGKADRNVMARFLEIAATFVENQNPRYIKMEKFDYMKLVNDQKIEELIEGHCFHLARHEDGEVVIYDTRE